MTKDQFSNFLTSQTTLIETMKDWRHDIHQNPELGFEEFRTSDKVATILEELGLTVYRNFGKTGVVGVLKGKNIDPDIDEKTLPTIGLRADMDALEIQELNDFTHKSQIDGKMHACGHDGHTTMLLGAAKALSEAADFNGIVYFIFQPAEEHGQGARAMIEHGLFEKFKIDAIYGIHNMPSIPTGKIAVRPGPIMACEDNFEIVIHGKGTHAALPHLGIDPIVVGAEIVTALQTIVARRLSPLDNAVISITEFITDGTRNVIPNTVTLKGDTRSFTPEMQDFIEENMKRIAEGIAMAHGATIDFTYSREFAATINTKAEVDNVTKVAHNLFGADQIDSNTPPIMASEDFGFMLQKKQGAYLFVGNGGDGPGGCGLHSPNYDFNDDILAVGTCFWVHLVLDQLNQKNK